jgi:hypothetical protein
MSNSEEEENIMSNSEEEENVINWDPIRAYTELWGSSIDFINAFILVGRPTVFLRQYRWNIFISAQSQQKNLPGSTGNPVYIPENFKTAFNLHGTVGDEVGDSDCNILYKFIFRLSTEYTTIVNEITLNEINENGFQKMFPDNFPHNPIDMFVRQRFGANTILDLYLIMLRDGNPRNFLADMIFSIKFYSLFDILLSKCINFGNINDNQLSAINDCIAYVNYIQGYILHFASIRVYRRAFYILNAPPYSIVIHNPQAEQRQRREENRERMRRVGRERLLRRCSSSSSSKEHG